MTTKINDGNAITCSNAAQQQSYKYNPIIAFHIGRGGRFYNGGHVTCLGFKDINDIVNIADDRYNLFTAFENQQELFDTIKGYDNLESKYYECSDNNDFSWFENKFNFDIGKLIYTSGDGNAVGLAVDNDGTGCINFDGNYNTYYCQRLSDCDDNEVKIAFDFTYNNYASIDDSDAVMNEMEERGLFEEEEGNI